MVSPSPLSPSPSPSPDITSFPCLQCDRVFFSARALSGHVSTGHEVLHPTQKFVGNSSVCQFCLLCVSIRPRLFQHLRQGKLHCANLIHSHSVPLPPAEVTAAMKTSGNTRCSLGQTRLTALVPLRRPLWPLWDPPPPPPPVRSQDLFIH